MVPGDIFPVLMTKFSDFLAIPLCDVYNTITASRIWPVCWKREHVTVIPKKTIPSGFGDLRNISCTLLTSKIYESYILEWASSEVQVKLNQYGGVKGCGTPHMLVELQQEFAENAEDNRAATVVTAVDYAKAFNRMSFQHLSLIHI